jgi:hypothetical protein
MQIGEALHPEIGAALHGFGVPSQQIRLAEQGAQAGHRFYFDRSAAAAGLEHSASGPPLEEKIRDVRLTFFSGLANISNWAKCLPKRPPAPACARCTFR